MKENYHKWYSQYISRDFEMLVFGHAGVPIILFPTSKGKYYEVKDMGLINSIENFIESGKVKIFCPDSIDGMSWYNYIIHPADRVKTHLAYERVILNDVIEFAKFECKTDLVGLAGCSFGGYHAANIAFKYPDKINSLITMGGSFDIKAHILGYYDDDCYFNNPVDYLPNLEDEWYLNNIKKMKIVLGSGEYDLCLEENKRLSGILNKKNIKHTFDIKPGAWHDWHCWRDVFPEYLSLIE